MGLSRCIFIDICKNYEHDLNGKSIELCKNQKPIKQDDIDICSNFLPCNCTYIKRG